MSGKKTRGAIMISFLRTSLLTGALLSAICSPAAAHHSHAMFDSTREVTIKGNVASFVFTNPHAYLYVDVMEANGQTVKYWIEMTNIPNMIRSGIRATTFKPGDAVTVVLHPLTDGRQGGFYKTVTAADGKPYSYADR
jgi:hypothetical protein